MQKITHDKLLDILYKVVAFVFNESFRDYTIINEQLCLLEKEGITSFLLNHYLKKQWNLFYITVFSLLEIIIMIHVIGIPMGFDPAPFFTNLFLAQGEANWVKA